MKKNSHLIALSSVVLTLTHLSPLIAQELKFEKNPSLHSLEEYEGSYEQETRYYKTLGIYFGATASFTKQRGTHSKGICSDATLNIEPIESNSRNAIVTEFLKHNELFKQSNGEFQTRVRFANAKTFSGDKITDNDRMDPKAVSLVVNYAEGKRQDFVLQNIPTFPLKDLKLFVSLMTFRTFSLDDEKVETAESITRKYSILQKLSPMINKTLALDLKPEELPQDVDKSLLTYSFVKNALREFSGAIYNKLGYWRVLPGVGAALSSSLPIDYPGLLIELKDLQKNQVDKVMLAKDDVKSYLTESYWSGTAFAMGENSALKYILKACSNTKAIEKYSNNKNEDYLSEEFKEQINTKTNACLDLYIQPLASPDFNNLNKNEITEHVENPTKKWNESWPVYKVATLKFDNSKLLSDEECNGITSAINVNKNTLNDIRPLGRINRGRLVPEQSSAKARLK